MIVSGDLGQFSLAPLLAPVQKGIRKLEGALKGILVLSGIAAATGVIILLRGRVRWNPARRRLIGPSRARRRRRR